MTAKLKLEGMHSSDGQKIARQHVRGSLTVYPQPGNSVFITRDTKARRFTWDKDQTEGSILNLNTVKTMGAPSGHWVATVKVAHDSDLDIKGGDIMDGDWVDIAYLRNGVEFEVMRGVVDSARERKYSAGGATVKVFQLTGRDCGAPFETPVAWQSFWVQTLGELFRGLMTDRVKGAIGGSPDEMFEILLEAAFQQGGTKNRSSWRLPPALAKIAKISEEPYFYKALENEIDPCRGAYYNEIQAWTQAGQTLHQTLQQWINPLLNEVWYDLRRGLKKIEGRTEAEMVAYLRERPFPNTTDGMESPWFRLDSLTIPDWVINEYDVGRGGDQRYNLIELVADFGFISPQESAAFAAPIWNYWDIQTHGLKPWQQNVRYVAKDNFSQGQWLAERKVWNKLVTDWYAPNPYVLDGTLGAGILLPEARIGTKLFYDTDNKKTKEQYYLEGVENKYTFTRAGHSGKTNLTVTRGFPGDDKEYLKMVERAAAGYEEVF
jgi:hypothetical protein